jgi:peptidoglycan/xylan/chitin deacetylase (PgdA/CDA1 family)
MKALLKNLFYRTVSFFNFSGAVVLFYHSVSDGREQLSVKPTEFARQMRVISELGLKVVRVSQLKEMMGQKSDLSKTVCLTFDDGYEDNLINVLPVLQQYGFGATVFISSALIGQSVTAREGSKLKVLSAEQIKTMVRGGLIDFGSHGLNHLKLTKLGDDRLEAEISLSRQALENLLEEKVIAFSYPYGNYDARVKEAVRRHYRMAFSVRPGRVKNSDDLLEIRRNMIDGQTSLAQFKGIIKFGRVKK